MEQRQPVHLRPTAPLAERVLLPGDPGRALALAQYLIDRPLMFNHHRGLWGYTGPALADGLPLTIQSTGMGGPSAAIVLHELIVLGARRAIRVGTCGALANGLALGDLVVAREALAADGASRMLGAGERIAGDRSLTAALVQAANGAAAAAGQAENGQGATEHRRAFTEYRRRTHVEATIVSTDLFYEPDAERELGWRSAGAIAVEMEAATLFAVGASADVQVACMLTVSNLLSESADHEQPQIDDDALLDAAHAMGDAALSALL